MPHPWTSKAIYSETEYDLSHLAPLTRKILCSDSQERLVEFRFHYHCFTEEEKGTDFRRPFRDDGWPDERRVFCPHRWFLSRRLKALIEGDIGKLRLIEATGYHWIYNERIPGISNPYAIFFKFGIGALKGPIVANIMSAYVKSGAQLKGNEQRLNALLTLAATQGKIPGRP